MLCRVSRIVFWNIMLMMFYMNVFYLPTLKQVVGQYTKNGMNQCFGLAYLCTTMLTCHCWYNVHNEKTSKILIFKVIRHHHELPGKLNSVVFELSFCLLFLKSVMGWHSGCIPLGWSRSWSVIEDHLHGSSKEPMNLLSVFGRSFPSNARKSQYLTK